MSTVQQPSSDCWPHLLRRQGHGDRPCCPERGKADRSQASCRHVQLAFPGSGTSVTRSTEGQSGLWSVARSEGFGVMTYRFISGTVDRAVRRAGGEIDGPTRLRPSGWRWPAQGPTTSHHVRVTPSNDVLGYLALNEGASTLERLRVRQAIAYAIDSLRRRQATSSGNARRQPAAIKKGNPCTASTPPHDIDKAKSCCVMPGGPEEPTTC